LALIDQGRIIALGTPAELKTQYMPEAVWELETDQLVDSLRILKERVGVIRESPELSEVAVFGSALHVLARKEEDLSSAIPSLLAGRGITTKRLERIVPSLEDVFVSLIEAKGRQATRKELIADS
jgi:ABC-2 type transport system ATP-binding protein